MNSLASHCLGGVIVMMPTVGCGARSTLDEFARAQLVTSGGATGLGGGSDGSAPLSNPASGGMTARVVSGTFTSGGVPVFGGAVSTGGSRASGGVTSGSRASGGATATGGVFPFGGAIAIGGLPASAGMTGAINTVVVASGGGSPDAGVLSDAGETLDGSNGLVPLSDADFASFTQAECSTWFSIMTPPFTDLELVVDVSASMNDAAPNPIDGRSKWDVTRSVLAAMLRQLPWTTRVGLLLWPNEATIPNDYTQLYQETGSVDGCVNTAASLAPYWFVSQGDHVQALVDALNAASPQGGTPTADAYAFAVEVLTRSTVASDRVVILLTDGQPSIQHGCRGAGDESAPVDNRPVLDRIEGARADESIKTYVIGLPGSEQASFDGTDGRAWLSRAAELGATALGADCRDTGPNYCHFDLSQSQDLEESLNAALASITEQFFPCRYRFPDLQLQQPLDMSRLNTIYVPQVGDSSDLYFVEPAQPGCDTGNGWYLDSKGGDYLVLCPNTCRALLESPATLQTFADCPALVRF